MNIIRQGYKGTIDPEEKPEIDEGNTLKHQEGKFWDYSVVPVVGVFFTNFFISGIEKKLLTKCRIMDEEALRPVRDDMRLVFIQIPSFNKRKRNVLILLTNGCLTSHTWTLWKE